MANPQTVSMVAAHILCQGFDLRESAGIVEKGRDPWYRQEAISQAAALALELCEEVTRRMEH